MNDDRFTQNQRLDIRERENESMSREEPVWLRGRREYQWFHENRSRIEEIIKVLQ